MENNIEEHEFVSETKKIGNSIMITIPKNIVDLAEIQENMLYKFKINTPKKNESLIEKNE